MIVRLLRSKDTLRQVIIYILIASSALIPAYLTGIAIHVPEGSSALYLLFSEMIEGLHESIKLLILCIVVLWLMFSLAQFTRLLLPGTGNRLTIPAFFSLLLLMMIPENISVHPLLIALLFLIPALKEILKIGKLKNPSISIFNGGFLLSLASLISYQVLLFAPVFFIILFVFRLYRWNYMAILATGLVSPWIYYFVTCWIFGWWVGPDLQTLHDLYTENFSAFLVETIKSPGAFHYPVILLMSILVLVSTIRVYSQINQHIVVNRSLFKALLWMLLPILAYISLSGGLVLQNFSVAAFFSVFVISADIQDRKNTRFMNILLIALVLSIIAGHIYPLIR